MQGKLLDLSNLYFIVGKFGFSTLSVEKHNFIWLVNSVHQDTIT